MGDRVYLSKAMTKYDGEKVFSFIIDTNATNEREALAAMQEELIDNVLGYEVKVKGYSLGVSSQIRQDTAEILVRSTRIRIELNEGFAIISIIK